MKINLLCTNGTKGSQSLKSLAQVLTQRLGYKVWRTAVAKPKRLGIKYGNSVDKLYQYNWFKQQGLSALEFTQDMQQAIAWCMEGQTVFGRKYLNSSCGKGIVVFDKATAAAIHGCPVYTLYKKKKREFRVHVFKDQVVAVTEKKRRKDFDGQRDTKIRNLANGYVFVQDVSDEPEGLRLLALRAAAVSQSDFRGVDIGFNEKNNDLFVIEVNSAPGIQGTNLIKYTEAIVNHV
jgi:glutathione synthase/RimK-type ligase-like ATP-grasp enzyme